MSNQDKLYGLLNTVKDGAYLAGTFALGALGLACEGAEKLADAVKLRCQAAQLAGELDGELLEAGELAYAAYAGDSTVSDVMEEKMRAIDALKLELGAVNDQLGRTPEAPEPPSCPACGASVRDGDRFCRACGAKLA